MAKSPWGWINDLCSSLVDTSIWTVCFRGVKESDGRFICGLSSGIAICVVAPYLSTLAKGHSELSGRSGQVGTMNQLAIVLGICSAQIAGLALTGSVS